MNTFAIYLNYLDSFFLMLTILLALYACYLYLYLYTTERILRFNSNSEGHIKPRYPLFCINVPMAGNISLHNNITLRSCRPFYSRCETGRPLTSTDRFLMVPVSNQHIVKSPATMAISNFDIINALLSHGPYNHWGGSKNGDRRRGVKRDVFSSAF